ncbi:unnamed protein product [Schistosoma mansoni]|uniref:Smp_202900 n=1 Tax=Schistosoma mansoni TaxID=6183 RepID=UPI00022C83FD|nr:unnamed protein product [Schistosoma mansoni]|eukprot:XP_018645710.1 unnamed protein product [Schistosoma mansoni]
MSRGDAKVRSRVYCYHLFNTGSLDGSCLRKCNPTRVVLLTYLLAFKNKLIT